MKSSFVPRLLRCLLATALLAAIGPTYAQQQTKKTGPLQSTAPAVQKQRPIPFHGTLAAVNPTARTLTVGKRTFVVTSDTKLYRNDKTVPGTLKNAVVGGRVTGSYIKGPDGNLLARSVYFKSPTAPAARPAKASQTEEPEE